MPNLNLKQFEWLMELPDYLQESYIQALDNAETIEQEIALGFLVLRPDFVYNAGRQFKVLAMWR